MLLCIFAVIWFHPLYISNKFAVSSMIYSIFCVSRTKWFSNFTVNLIWIAIKSESTIHLLNGSFQALINCVLQNVRRKIRDWDCGKIINRMLKTSPAKKKTSPARSLKCLMGMLSMWKHQPELSKKFSSQAFAHHEKLDGKLSSNESQLHWTIFNQFWHLEYF